MVFFKKACGLKFLKRGGVVNFSWVVGVYPYMQAEGGVHPHYPEKGHVSYSGLN